VPLLHVCAAPSTPTCRTVGRCRSSFNTDSSTGDRLVLESPVISRRRKRLAGRARGVAADDGTMVTAALSPDLIIVEIYPQALHAHVLRAAVALRFVYSNL
jgi:hypothetical protein